MNVALENYKRNDTNAMVSFCTATKVTWIYSKCDLQKELYINFIMPFLMESVTVQKSDIHYTYL